MGEKGEIYGTIAAIIVLGLILGYALNIEKYTGECKTDAECGAEKYCGSDYKCRSHPVIEKTRVINNYQGAASILGVSFIIAALILRRKSFLE